MQRRDIDTLYRDTKAELEKQLSTANALLEEIRQKLTESENNRQQGTTTLASLNQSYQQAVTLINQTNTDLAKVTELRAAALDPTTGLEPLLAKVVATTDKAEQLYGQEIYLSKTKSGKVRRIAWKNRVLRFDVTPSIFKKNIDVVLLSTKQENDEQADQALMENKANYVACGELKGGIDPAGADEHWKTANSALSRIREAFTDNGPALFFVGAAIEASMADEIYKQLKDKRLSYAANLNDKSQFDDLVNWLITL